jgi:hypothetical protein
MVWDEDVKETQTLNCFNIILFAIFITVILVLLLTSYFTKEKMNIMICKGGIIDDYLYLENDMLQICFVNRWKVCL